MTTTSTTQGPDRSQASAGATTDQRSESGPGRDGLVNLLFGFFPVPVLHLAAHLRLADRVAAKPRTAAELAAETDSDEDALHRVLRALGYFGVLDEVAPRTFGLGPQGHQMRADVDGSILNLVLLFAGPGVWQSWGELPHSVRTGDPAWDEVTGAPSFDALAADSDLQQVFNRAMSEGTRNAAPGIVEAGRFDRFHRIIDLGGGDGTLLSFVLAAHTDLHGAVLDTPTGIAGATDTLTGAGVADRAETLTGDFFASVPAGYDAYLVKSVIHDWDDARATDILRACREAMAADATLLVVEPIMPEGISGDPASLMTIMSDLNMLVCTGGKERTEAEFRALFDTAGFALRSMTPIPGRTQMQVLEATPRPD